MREKVALALRLRRRGASYREIARAVACGPRLVFPVRGAAVLLAGEAVFDRSDLDGSVACEGVARGGEPR